LKAEPKFIRVTDKYLDRATLSEEEKPVYFQANPSGRVWFRSPNSVVEFLRCSFDWSELVDHHFLNCHFIECKFNKGAPYLIGPVPSEIKGCRFTDCLFKSCGFEDTTFIDVRFHHCRLFKVRVNGFTKFQRIRLSATRGFEKIPGLHLVKVPDGLDELNEDLERLPLGLLDRLASWERLRTFGRLPLFGLSFSTLIAIPTVAFLLATYNKQVAHLHDWADRYRASIEYSRLHDWVDPYPEAVERISNLAEFASRLQAIPLPSLTFWLLISTVLLGIGSALFSLVCPARIREFSLQQWMHELRRSALHYLPFSWQYRWTRGIAFVCYVVGGLGTLTILLLKLWNAATFIIKNTDLPWYFS
jgi:hypothetical protein